MVSIGWYTGVMEKCTVVLDGEACVNTRRWGDLCSSHARHQKQYGEFRKIKNTRPKRSNAVRNERGEKLCRNCENWYSESEFNRDGRKIDGLSIYCRVCTNKWSLDGYYRNGGYDYGRQVWSLYRLSKEDYDNLLISQDYRCAACGSDNPQDRRQKWHVDHDHACCNRRQSCGNCIRGLLCSNCNIALGLVKDSKNTLLSLVEYLDRPHFRR